MSNKIGRTIVRQFQYRSSSSPNITYSTLLYDDGTASCNCPAWTRRVDAQGARTCKHLIAAGISPISVSEPSGARPSSMTPAKKMKHGQPADVSAMRVVRKFRFADED